ncbi:MAG: hypothetical protein Q7J40_01415 [Atribacterota bacterium]|nr:hypothetical protein [Atribacterota bacterium]
MGIASDVKTLSEDIVASYDSRVKALGKLVADTRKTLKGFAEDRKNLSNFTKDLTENVDDMLKEFGKNHKQMADNLKEDLEKGETERLKDFKPMMVNIRKGIKDIETSVKNQLGGFTDEREKMAGNWQSLVATMAKKRGGKAKVEDDVKVRPVEEIEAMEEEVKPKPKGKKGKRGKKGRR